MDDHLSIRNKLSGHKKYELVRMSITRVDLICLNDASSWRSSCSSSLMLRGPRSSPSRFLQPKTNYSINVFQHSSKSCVSNVRRRTVRCHLCDLCKASTRAFSFKYSCWLLWFLPKQDVRRMSIIIILTTLTLPKQDVRTSILFYRDGYCNHQTQCRSITW